MVGLVLAAFVHGGLYQIVIAGSEGGGEGIAGSIEAYRMNRFTGEIILCHEPFACGLVHEVRWPEPPAHLRP